MFTEGLSLKKLRKFGGGVIFFILLCMGCTNPEKTINTENQISLSGDDTWEADISDNKQHHIETIPTREYGTEVFVNGKRESYDVMALEYNPVINDNGNYAYISELSGEGYRVVVDGDIVFDTGALLHYLKISDTQAIFFMLDKAENVTRLYSVDIAEKQWSHVSSYKEEYIEEARAYSLDRFAFITSRMSVHGEKSYSLYSYDTSKDELPEKLIEDSRQKLFFTTEENIKASVFMNRADEKAIIVDKIELTENAAYLFNAYRLVYGEQRNSPFSKANDFRGRISWNESYRIRGLAELYKKTEDKDLYEKIVDTARNVLAARNHAIDVEENEYLPGFLWCEKAYSIDQKPISCIVNNCEILSALLFTLTEGVIKEDCTLYNDILRTAVKAYEYYETDYKEGHYSLPPGYPMAYDGMEVPWNWQNSMAEVLLDLYLLTGNDKYLIRCEELLSEFKNEWTLDGERIYWRYWPSSYYRECGISEQDALYEDTSHASISVRLLCRYYSYISDGIVLEDDLKKIQNSMKYFCFQDGFSGFINGDTEYQPKAWIYPAGTWWSYLNNDEYENFIRQGSINSYPEWDNIGRLFTNAKYFDPDIENTEGTVERLVICFDRDSFQISTKDSFHLDDIDIKEYVKNN